MSPMVKLSNKLAVWIHTLTQSKMRLYGNNVFHLFELFDNIAGSCVWNDYEQNGYNIL